MSTDERLRVHPHERLAGAVQHIDLDHAIAGLRAEAHAATSGHRQVVLARHGSRVIMLFAFEPNAELKPHKAEGEVTIHVLSGALEVMVASGMTLLSGGQLLALAAGERHSVRAVQASEMLLTVCQQSR